MTAPGYGRVRRSLGLLVLVSLLVTVAPGLLAYAGLRSLGLGIGGSGVIAILVMMGGMVGYCGWLFGGGRRAHG